MIYDAHKDKELTSELKTIESTSTQTDSDISEIETTEAENF